jgi:hypothetical protein
LKKTPPLAHSDETAEPAEPAAVVVVGRGINMTVVPITKINKSI